MFYYIHSGDKNKKHICYLFDKNSVNEEVSENFYIPIILEIHFEFLPYPYDKITVSINCNLVRHIGELLVILNVCRAKLLYEYRKVSHLNIKVEGATSSSLLRNSNVGCSYQKVDCMP